MKNEEDKEETKKYFHEKVNPIFSELMVSLLKNKP